MLGVIGEGSWLTIAKNQLTQKDLEKGTSNKMSSFVFKDASFVTGTKFVSTGIPE